MKQQINGRLGNWATRCAKARPIEVGVKVSCLGLFKQGVGYKRASRELGLMPYTVRDWLRRFKSGDESWATRDGREFRRCPEARDLVKYRHEIKAFVSCRGAGSARDGSLIRAKRSFAGRENQMAGSAEHAAAIPLYRAEEARERILSGGLRKKKRSRPSGC